MGVDDAGFGARGGWWVVAQVPVMAGALAVPLVWGAKSFDVANAVQLLGAVWVAAGAFVAIAGVAALGRALTPFPRPVEDARLRQSGVYGWVRHPIYSGLLLASLGWSLAWLSLPGVAFTALVFLFFDRKAAFEERLLEARFPEYTAYARRVGKLVPWIH
jgi:protein-S-isoprenylcysteine O-methyltransferase Ste14